MDLGQVALLTVKDVARQLQVSAAWVHDHSNGRRRPVLKRVRVGKHVRFRPVDVESFIREHSEVA
jgi:hypothetical protein